MALTTIWRRFGLKFVRVFAFVLAMLMPGCLLAEGDFDAQMAFASAEIEAGRPAAGVRAAKQAFSLAEGKVARVRAARVVAAGYFEMRRLAMAERWLRRALDDAPDRFIRDGLVREIKQVRAQNPLRVNLNFAAAPSSNVNNGLTGDQVLIWEVPFELSPEAQALSGLEFSATANLAYRLSKSQNSQTELGLLAFGRTYQMSRQARQAAPGIKGRDISYGNLTLSLRHQRKLIQSQKPVMLQINLGQSWYGGQVFDSPVSVSVFQEFRLNEKSKLSLYSTLEHRRLQQEGPRNLRTLTIGTGLAQRLENNGILDFLISAQDTLDPGQLRTHRALRGKIAYKFPKPVLNLDLSLSAGLGTRRYPYSAFSLNARRDSLFDVGITAVFNQASKRGFSPFTNLRYRQTVSNIPLYNRRTATAEFGAKSDF